MKSADGYAAIASFEKVMHIKKALRCKVWMHAKFSLMCISITVCSISEILETIYPSLISVLFTATNEPLFTFSFKILYC